MPLVIYTYEQIAVLALTGQVIGKSTDCFLELIHVVCRNRPLYAVTLVKMDEVI